MHTDLLLTMSENFGSYLVVYMVPLISYWKAKHNIKGAYQLKVKPQQNIT